ALRPEFSRQVVKIEVDDFLYCLLDGVALPDFVEVTEAVAVIDGRHLVLVVNAFLSRPQNGIIDVAGRNLNFPRWRDEWLRPGGVCGMGHSELVIGQGIGD